PPRRPSCCARTAAAVEKATEDIAQTAVRRKSSTGSSSEEVRGVEVLRLAKPAGKSGTSASAEAAEAATGAEHRLQLVVFLALGFVADDVIGLGRLLEAFLGGLVPGV